MSRLEQLKKLVMLDPSDPMSHYGVGLECINLERWTEAAEAFSHAIAADAKYSAAYYHKARAQISGGEHDAARATLAQGIEAAKAARDWHTQAEMQELLESLA